MLDGINAGVQGVLDSLGTLGMRRGFAVSLVRLVDRRLHFFHRQLRTARFHTRSHYAAGCHDLDQIHAVLQQLAGMLAAFVYAIGFQSAFPAMAAGHRNHPAGTEHVRSDDQIIIFFRPQRTDKRHAAVDIIVCVLHPPPGFFHGRQRVFFLVADAHWR